MESFIGFGLFFVFGKVFQFEIFFKFDTFDLIWEHYPSLVWEMFSALEKCLRGLRNI
jgi:hypothetical protein